MTEKNIVLIGFMGTGKTTVGKILAKRLKRPWVDIDQRIEERQKRKIQDIFEKDGEATFRKLEKQMITEVASHSNQVITTGGGAVLDEENRQLLRKGGVLVALSASAETIYERVKDSRHRPMLNGADAMTQIRRLLEQRQPFYQKADIALETDGRTATEVAAAIAVQLENEQDFEFGKDWF